MSGRPTRPRAIRAPLFAVVVALAFAARAWGAEPGGPPPTTPAAKGAATSPGAPPSSAPAAPGAGAPTGAPAAAAPAERNPDCDRYVAALQGRGDASLLDKAEVRTLANSASDLVMCRAVESNSDAVCTKLMGEDRGPSMACRQTVYTFRELRAHPNTNAFMFTESDVQECRKVPWADAKMCDTLREALLANDAEKCAALGERQTMCRAYVGLDPALCELPPEAEQQFRDAIKKAGPEVYAKQKDEAPLADKCRQAIASKKFLAQGLKALSESGPPRERALARAALGQADACAPFAETALKACPMAAPASAPGAAPAGEKATPKAGTAPAAERPAPKPDGAPAAERPKS